MRKQDKLGVTAVVPDGVDQLGVYDDADGVEVFETDAPYLMEDGKSLISPLPVIVVEDRIYVDRMGNAQSALGVKGLTQPPPAGITWDNNTPWDGGAFWS